MLSVFETRTHSDKPASRQLVTGDCVLRCVVRQWISQSTFSGVLLSSRVRAEENEIYPQMIIGADSRGITARSHYWGSPRLPRCPRRPHYYALLLRTSLAPNAIAALFNAHLTLLEASSCCRHLSACPSLRQTRAAWQHEIIVCKYVNTIRHNNVSSFLRPISWSWV